MHRSIARRPAADDLCRTATAEAARGFENNALYLREPEEDHHDHATSRSEPRPGRCFYDVEIPAQQAVVRHVGKGQILRIVDLEGQQAVDTLFYNAA